VRPGLTIAVTNETGLGIVPMHPLARRYRDVLGRVNAVWVGASDESYLVVAGRRIRLEEAL
jgi:adenosyl cobinamide kinase/adenosyl cobinamide phosphate guanylyltransferase